MADQIISLSDFCKELEDAALDVCDQTQIIKIAMEQVEGHHAAAFALLRSIKSFNDQIFGKLQSVLEELEKPAQRGGA